MATVWEHKNKDRTRSFTAGIRVRGFNPTSKTFHERDYGGRKEARAAAHRWAEEREAELREQRARGGVRSDVASMTVRQLIDEHCKDPEVRALATFDDVERQLAWWCNKFGATKAIEFPSPVLLRQAREMLSAGRGPATVNRYMAAARAAVNWARAGGLLPINLAWPPRLALTEPAGRKRYLTDEELGRALEAAGADSPLMRAAVMFAIGVGCRQGEQLRVRWGDLDATTSTVAITVSKTETSGRRWLAAPVLEALNELKGGNVSPLPSAYVFCEAGAVLTASQLSKRWRRVRRAARLPDLRWHDLRHSCASFLIQGQATLAEVAHQLGHKHIATSARYAHLVAGAAPTGAAALNAKLARRRET